MLFRSCWVESDLMSNVMPLFVVAVGVYGLQEREGEDAAVSEEPVTAGVQFLERTCPSFRKQHL